MLKDQIEKIVKETVQKTVNNNRKIFKNNSNKSKITTVVKKTVKTVLTEAVHLLPKSFTLKTEKLSSQTKEAHELLYKKYVDSYNKISSEISAASKESVESNRSPFRSFKMDEQYNLNAVKLHEMYFGNISDLASEISFDSIPYIKLARDFGTFESWQFDFIACAMAAREGWAVTVYEPYNKTYMNVVVDGHSTGLPLGAIPILVLDMWSHSYYKDYVGDKRSYVVSMMREINWNIIEARMTITENARIHDVWNILPLVNNQPEKMLSAAELLDPTPVKPVDAEYLSPQQNPEATAPQHGLPSAPLGPAQYDKRMP